jgi:hypothetical protein
MYLGSSKDEMAPKRGPELRLQPQAGSAAVAEDDDLRVKIAGLPALLFGRLGLRIIAHPASFKYRPGLALLGFGQSGFDSRVGPEKTIRDLK